MITRLMELHYWRFEIKNFKKKKNKIIKLINKYPLTKEGIQNYSTNTNLFQKDYNKHQEFIQEVSTFVMEELKSFAKDIKNNIRITKAWGVNYKKGEDQIMHHHGNKGYTAILFVNFDAKKHSPVIFKKFWPNITSGSLEFTAPYPNIKEGSLIVFPTCVEHFAPVNLSDKDRTIIGFDLDFNNEQHG
tara:strand:+ start:763 stop:1326 length:564 start_codon:yes stop_codon:yes gene_type:complete